MKPLKPFDISLSGINLVEASAGTGKTYNIASLYVRALIEGGFSVSEILVVTFTKAATKELKDRLLSRLNESIQALETGAQPEDQFLTELCDHVSDKSQAIHRLEQARRTFDEAAIFTIHGFCQQVLQDQAFESRALYGMEMIGDDTELLLEVIDDYWRSWVAELSENPLKQPLLRLIIDQDVTPEKLAQTLGGIVERPYMKVQPEEARIPDLESKLQQLSDCYEKMQSLWSTDRAEILQLLSRDEMSNYRSDWLAGWMDKMDELLASETAAINIFDQFERFTQSYIDESLKVDAQRKGVQPPQHPFFKVADDYQQLANTLVQYLVLVQLEFLEYVREELPKRKEELEVLSYSDLLLQLERALYAGERGDNLARKLRRRYPIAMVDEFQDTDPSQYKIFRKIYRSSASNPSPSALFMIGDPKQSIYSFRGADVFSYLEAKQDAVAEKTFNLGRNFRSVPSLIEGINVLFGEHADPFVIDEINFEPVRPGREPDEYRQLTEAGETRPPIQFRNFNSDEEEQASKSESAERAAIKTADEIQRLLKGGEQGDIRIGAKALEAGDIAILVQRHKQGDKMKEALQNWGIKSVQYSQQSVFKSEEAGHLSIVLKAIVEPSNEAAVMAALATPLMGYSANELLAIEEEEQGWIALLDRFSGWHRQWNEEGFAAMFGHLMKEAGVATEVMRYPNGERRLTNLLHLGELLQEQDQLLQGGRGLLKWLARKRQEDQKQQDEEQLRLESDEGLVKIVTMHRSKGLEYPVVFCPFLWYGPRIQDRGQALNFHDGGETYVDLQGKQDPDRTHKRWMSRREELAESMRLAYVAITRAEHRCYLGWCYANKSEFSPFGYLLYGAEASANALKQTISDKYEALGADAARQTIAKLCKSYPDLFSDHIPAPQGDQQLSFGETLESPRLKARRFNRTLPLESSYRVSSFSSLTSAMDEHDPDIPDYDQFLYIYDDMDTSQELDREEEQNMFTFPKGPQPGTCVHKIFEDIDFREVDQAREIIHRNLSTYGIDTEWTPVVEEMLNVTLNKPLLADDKDFRLSAISDKAQVQELEFYYKTADIEATALLDIIRPDADTGWQRGRAATGFLKGFIDLTFQYGDKYYILDYKTNYLGDTLDDYDQPALEHEMREASYDLQYHIYTIALHRFLGQKLPDYSYEKHFGGAFYLFLRGLNEQAREGIFFDRPDAQTIDELNEYILAGGHDE